MTASVGYYPGCSLKGSGKDYEESLKAVAKTLSMELKEIPGWLCCGATSAHAIDHTLATSLAGDTMAKAQAAGFEQIFAPCAMCYSRLATVSYNMRTVPGFAERLEAALGAKPGLKNLKIKGILNWLDDMPDEVLLAPQKKSLAGLKIACYYGCLLVRPQKITGVANAERPENMERVLKLLGAEPIMFNMATACCGASFSLSDKPAVLRMCRKIVDDAAKAGANCIAVACPMCHSNLDMRQPEYKPSRGPVPVLFITQLMGLAYGLSSAELGLGGHFVPTDSITAALQAVTKG